MPTAPTTTTEENKAAVRRLIEEVWNQGNLAIADELIADMHMNHDPASPDYGLGPMGVKQNATFYRRAFPDLCLTIEDMFAEGDKVLTRWTSTGTHNGDLQNIAATGKRINLSGMTITRFARGKMIEEWANWDALGMMKQLGVITE